MATAQSVQEFMDNDGVERRRTRLNLTVKTIDHFLGADNGRGLWIGGRIRKAKQHIDILNAGKIGGNLAVFIQKQRILSGVYKSRRHKRVIKREHSAVIAAINIAAYRSPAFG